MSTTLGVAFDSKATAIRIMARMAKFGFPVESLGDRATLALASAIKSELDDISLTRGGISVAANDNTTAQTASQPREQPRDAKKTDVGSTVGSGELLEQFRADWKLIFGHDSEVPLATKYCWMALMVNQNLGPTPEARKESLVAVAVEAKSKLGTNARYMNPSDAFLRILANARQGQVYGNLKKAFNDIKRRSEAVR